MYRTRGKNAGFTILSIMVGTAISLFLLVGILNVYLNNKNTFTYQTALAATAENGRFATDDLARVLYMTGRGLLASESPFPAVGSDLYNGNAGASDGLAVIYAEGLDCQGNAVTAASQQTFMVEPDDEGNNALKCSVNGGTKEPPLASGIESMQVLYGVDEDADDSANRYLNATEVNVAGLWNNVVSLRIGLVVSSGEFLVSPEAEDLTPAQIAILDETFTPVDNRRIYKAITTTVPLRNLTIVER